MNTTAQPNENVVAYCRTCGKPLSEAAKREVHGVIYCEDCLAARMQGAANTAGAAAVPTPVAYVPSAPSPGLAFLLGWIPGVGAMYNGQVAKGFVHVGIFALIVSILNSGAGGLEPLFGLGLAAFIVYMPIEAYQTARALRFGQPVPDHLRILHMLESFGLRSDAGMRTTVGTAPAAAVTPEGVPVQTAVPVYAAPVVAEAPEPREEKVPVSAIVLIGLGILFLLSTMNVFQVAGRFIFPGALIALGIWLAARRLARG